MAEKAHYDWADSPHEDDDDEERKTTTTSTTLRRPKTRCRRVVTASRLGGSGCSGVATKRRKRR